eukprot:4182902-Amphidinium_carterae.1
MTLLIQQIKGDIRSHMLMTYNLPTADFDDSCTKVEDYYRNVYIDDSSGQIGLLKKNTKKWPYWKDKKWQYGSGKGKYDYDRAKGGKDQGGKDYKGKTKGKKGKGRGGKSKGKGKGYYNYYNSYDNGGKSKGYYDGKNKGKGDGGKPKGPPLPTNYSDYRK